MKLSEELATTANQNKKRKRELASNETRTSENVDDAGIKSPTKRNKRTSPEVDKHLFNDTPNFETATNSIAENNSTESSNATGVRSETSVEKISPKKNKKKKKKIEIPSIVDTATSNSSKNLSTNSLSNCNEESKNTSIADSINDALHSEPNSSRKKKKNKNQTSAKVDIVSSINSVDVSTKLLPNNEDTIASVDSRIIDVPYSESNSPRKSKNKKNTDPTHLKSEIASSNNSMNLSTNKEEIMPVTDSTNDISQPQSSLLKNKNKRKKTNKIDNDNSGESLSIPVNEPTNTSGVNISDSIGELVTSSETLSPRRGRKRKLENSKESESVQSNNSSDTPVVDSNSFSATGNTNQPSETVKKASPKEPKKKKTKLDKNFNLSEPIASSNSSENVSTSEAPSKPLKSCLKKKKRKSKKKKNQKKSNENSFEDEKKSTNRSVSFDSNVQVEVIENCLVKGEVQNARKKDKALAYLKRWKEKQNWKFQKLTQLWLLKNMFREDMIPSDDFDCLLDYMVDLKGVARTLVDDLCEKVISNVAEKGLEEDKELQTAYTRARAVLQRLQ